ncbi:hypothetical protein NE865_03068 [Phthorimaea operculella]|nr:hypothetical protein NE865_03068 [Phthorimaea operculella]
MSAKLIVHKFESGNNFKSLQITIDDGENGSNTVSYSEWYDGKPPHEKELEESPRMVITVDRGNDYCSSINLDSCAIDADKYKGFCNDNAPLQVSNKEKQNLLCYEVNDTGSTYTNETSKSETHKSKDAYNNTIGKDARNGLENANILEYSLERVKENNARIMENINMLNRTLNYTKKKEVLDESCCNALRYPCDACGKCFVYETGLKRHYAVQHALKQQQPRWQVVWTCVECFQVWPRRELKQCCRTDNADSVREMKTSLLLQCEFCEKVYTSIPRLLRHSKSHTTARNYECNGCKLGFTSYKAAELHWQVCPHKHCYSFTLPKMLLCNTCDRKFKTYEQLYNHRYKTCHFMTKTHFINEMVFKLRNLVYQCETCGQWFPAIIHLQMHKNQHYTITGH